MSNKRIERIAQSMVLDRGTKARAVAAQIGKPYPTLLRELNPNDKGAKMGVTTLMDIMRITNDISPLAAMAEEMGFSLVPNSAKSDQQEHEHFGRIIAGARDWDDIRRHLYGEAS